MVLSVNIVSLRHMVSFIPVLHDVWTAAGPALCSCSAAPTHLVPISLLMLAVVAFPGQQPGLLSRSSQLQFPLLSRTGPDRVEPGIHSAIHYSC